VCNIIRETVPALISILQECLPSPNEEIWNQKAARFSILWNFPNACGALDGKHVRVKAPPGSGSLYYNYKSYFSIVLLAIADADFQFTAVDIGAYGSESDGGILWKSSMGKRLREGTLGLPQPTTISGSEVNVPHVLLGDDAFPLRTSLMKPYKGNYLSKDKRIFNYRLSRARMTVENAFGILAARWRIFHSVIEAETEFVKQLVMCTVLLHNFLMSKKDLNNILPDRFEDGELVEGNWRSAGQDSLINLAHQSSNNFSVDAAQVRDRFREYFVSEEGSVPWQDSHVDE